MKTKDLLLPYGMYLVGIQETGELWVCTETRLVRYFSWNELCSCPWTNEWLNSNDTHKEYLFLMEKNLPKKQIIISKDISNQTKTVLS